MECNPFKKENDLTAAKPLLPVRCRRAATALVSLAPLRLLAMIAGLQQKVGGALKKIFSPKLQEEIIHRKNLDPVVGLSAYRFAGDKDAASAIGVVLL